MTNPKIEEIKNNQFARACSDDGILPKWHYEIDYLLGELDTLRAAKALHDKQYKDELEIFKHEIDLWKNKFDRHDDIMDGRGVYLKRMNKELDTLRAEVERLNAAVKERDDFIYVRGKHVIELADKNDTLRAEVEQLKQYRDHIYDYVQGTGNTSPKFLGHHLAKALVLDHKALRAALKDARDALEFYSTPGVWGIAGPGERVSVDPCDWEQIEVGEMKQLDMRGGKRAREAIKKIEGVL